MEAGSTTSLTHLYLGTERLQLTPLLYIYIATVGSVVKKGDGNKSNPAAEASEPGFGAS